MPQSDAKVRATFVWHMHQPTYFEPGQTDALLPWVRLHACKAYTDLADALERHPEVRCAVNFSGVLAWQIQRFIDGARDAWWHLTLRPADRLDAHERRFLLEQFFSIHHDRHVRADPRYAELLAARTADPAGLSMSVGDLRDLQVLFNLHWCGATMRRDSAVVRELHLRRSGFSERDKVALLEEQVRWVAQVPDRWRRLAHRGQVELTATPFHHPILPLLIDSACAVEGLPAHPLPRRFSAPEDAVAQVREGVAAVEALFGEPVVGCWPAEGSVSPAAAEVFARCGVRWIASDEEVLHRSTRSAVGGNPAHRAWAVGTASGDLTMVFRDHALSDRIGFVYANVPPARAARDLVERIAGAEPGALVPIILDGENPWEAYEDDGGPFLDALFERLGKGGAVETVLPREIVADADARIERLHAGSWIHANFRIWVGVPAKNLQWELLGDARRAVFAAADHADPAALRRAEAYLRGAEASDWFWWAGDDFASTNDSQFEALFRAHVAAAWEAIGTAVPPRLLGPLSGESGSSSSQVTVAARDWVEPVIDGRVTSYFEWAGAGQLLTRAAGGAMARVDVPVVRWGFTPRGIAVLVVLDGAATRVRLSGSVQGRTGLEHAFGAASDRGAGATRRVDGPCTCVAAFDEVVEAEIRVEGSAGVEIVAIWLEIEVDGVRLARYPEHGFAVVGSAASLPGPMTWLV